MRTTNLLAKALISICALLLLTACGAAIEQTSKSVAETALEKAAKAETGEDVNIDLDGIEKGEINISTSDGDIKINIDEASDSASAVITTEDGSTITAQTKDGEAVILDDKGNILAEAKAEGESGSWVITDDDGTKVHISSEQDGEQIDWQADGMSGSVTQGGALPDGFPKHIKFAEGLEILTVQSMAEEGETLSYVLTMVGEGDPSAYTKAAVTELEKAGFTIDETSDAPGQVANFYGAVFTDDQWVVEVFFVSADNEVQHTYMITPKSN